MAPLPRVGAADRQALCAVAAARTSRARAAEASGTSTVIGRCGANQWVSARRWPLRTAAGTPARARRAQAASAVATRDYDWSVEEHESLSSMRQRLSAEGPAFLTQVRDVVSARRLDDTFVDALCEPAEVFTYGGMIAHVLTFAAHRRTLVVLALGSHGVSDLVWGDPMLWVAQPA